jgi:hypothetical protein
MACLDHCSDNTEINQKICYGFVIKITTTTTTVSQHMSLLIFGPKEDEVRNLGYHFVIYTVHPVPLGE